MEITPGFSHFVALTLQDRMPWKMLSSILIKLAPTLNETREIICILLKELEVLHSTLQKKEKELEKYQKNGISKEYQKNNAVNQNTQGSEQQNADMLEAETMSDEIEILEIVKESMNDEILLDMNEETKPIDTFVNKENDEHDSGEAEESMGGWYTFVKDAKTIVPQTEASVQEKEFCPETEPTSFIESENNKQMAEENMSNADMSVNEIDNEWYT